MQEEDIIELVEKSIKKSSRSSRTKDLKPKKLIELLDNQFIFLSLEGNKLNSRQVKIEVQNLITQNILEGSGYSSEFMINEFTFANDLLNKFTLQKK